MNVTWVPPNRSPPLVTPTLTGGRPSRNSFSNVPFLRAFCLISVCVIGGWNSMSGPGGAEVGSRDRVQRLVAVEGVDAVLALVVGDEGDLGVALLVLQHDRRDVGRQRVGVLLELAALEAQRPQIEDVAVPRHFRIDRLIGIERGRREDQGLGVDELRAAVVVRAKRQLRLGAVREVEPEQLVVAADALQIDERLAVGRPRRARSRRTDRSSRSSTRRFRARRRRCRRSRRSTPRRPRSLPSGLMSGDSGRSTVFNSMRGRCSWSRRSGE